MGTMVEAVCACGYSSGVMALGVERSNHNTNCGFPCYCSACKSLFKPDMYADEVACPNCDTSSILPYDDPSLAPTGEVVGEIFSWNTLDRLGRELILHNEKFLCLSCYNFSTISSYRSLWLGT